MNAMTKLILFFAILGCIGAGIYFFPQAKNQVSNIILVVQGEAAEEAESAEDGSAEEERFGSRSDVENVVSEEESTDDDMELNLNE